MINDLKLAPFVPVLYVYKGVNGRTHGLTGAPLPKQPFTDNHFSDFRGTCANFQ